MDKYSSKTPTRLNTSDGNENGTKAKSKFDVWNLIKRPNTADPYALATKYRLSKGNVRRIRSGLVTRNRKQRPTSETGSSLAVEDSSHSQTTTTDFDLDRDFLEEYDYEAEDDMSMEQPRQSVMDTHTQQLYVRACKELGVTPASYFLRNLNSDQLCMQHHSLGPIGVKACAIALVTNPTVSTLDLADNDLGPKGACYIADMLRENHFITSLSLADNNIGEKGAEAIVSLVRDLDNLHQLDLSGNNFRECDAEIFRDVIEESHNLKVLNLSHNQFRESGGEVIGEALAWNDTIEVLDLSWNHLRRGGGVAIAEAVEVNTGITNLNLAWNGLYLDGCKALSKALEKNYTLLELNLCCNRINKECLDQLMKGLKKNTTLQTLRIGWNPITPVGASALVTMINDCKASTITELDLGMQLVEPLCAEMAANLRSERDVVVTFGMIRGHDQEGVADPEAELVNENPVIVLIEFGKLMGFRLMDLFAAMDKDGSKSLDKIEIKTGLKMANIPLSDKLLDKLIEKLDIDGDGEIDFGELMVGQQEHRRKMSKVYQAQQHDDIDMEDTEVGRIRIKLQRLMAKKMADNPQFKRQSRVLLQQMGLDVPEQEAKQAPASKEKLPAVEES